MRPEKRGRLWNEHGRRVIKRRAQVADTGAARLARVCMLQAIGV
jgi:hypothetical protein